MAILLQARGRGYQHCNCEHAHIRSVLGITDEVLADTNRFLLGEMRYGHPLKLDKPLLGCTEARLYLDEMGLLRRTDARKSPHRLLFNMGVICRRQESAIDTVKVEKELDIGEDCADKLAKAIRREIDEHAARRKKPTKP